MNPMLKDVAGTLFRALIIASPWLAKYGLTATDAEKIFGAVTILCGALWGVWSGRSKRQKLVTSLAMPNKSTEIEVQAKIADGQAPSVMTPANVVPVLAPKTSPAT